MSKIHNQIQWYPGHMAKAKREISDSLKLVDVVIEIIDARIPISSRNPILNNIIGNKKHIIVLNKADLSDNNINKKWIDKFKNKGEIAVLTDSNSGKGVKEVIDIAYELLKDKVEKEVAKGKIGFAIKAMIVGIPNVGKSSFINKIAGRNIAAVENKPGVTKKNQWVRLNDKIQLLDTPGVLWPKLDNELYAKHLAYIGTIKDDIIDIEELAISMLEELSNKYKIKIYERYKIEEDFEFKNGIELLEKIGRKRGCLLKGNNVDYIKSANIVIDNFRNGLIGKISLEE